MTTYNTTPGIWAEIDENNIVLRVILCSEEEAMAFGGTWLETFESQWNKNNPRTFRMASIGDRWEPEYNCFSNDKLYSNWVWDEDQLNWVPPVPRPPRSLTNTWMWNQETNEWDSMPLGD